MDHPESRREPILAGISTFRWQAWYFVIGYGGGQITVVGKFKLFRPRKYRGGDIHGIVSTNFAVRPLRLEPYDVA